MLQPSHTNPCVLLYEDMTAPSQATVAHKKHLFLFYLVKHYAMSTHGGVEV
jgi:hypothetical protein